METNLAFIFSSNLFKYLGPPKYDIFWKTSEEDGEDICMAELTPGGGPILFCECVDYLYADCNEYAHKFIGKKQECEDRCREFYRKLKEEKMKWNFSNGTSKMLKVELIKIIKI